MEVSLQSFKKRFTYDSQKDLLGKGGFGEVYKAYDTEDHIFVALKISQGTTDDKYNLINEIKRFKKLNHTNIVKHIEAYEVNTGSSDIHGKPIAYHVGILEYANNGTLADLLKKGTPDYRLIEDLAKDIIEGLAYLHSENIIHRDLKPTNILLFSEGEKLRAKITDFGIAKRTDATAASTQLVGTVEYMAPQFFSTGNITPASDVWSVGVMLLEALTGTHPFGKTTQGLSNEQIINNILNKDLSTATQNLRAPFKEIITRCLLRETNLRPQSAAELKGLLQETNDSFSERTQVIDTTFRKAITETPKSSWNKWGAALFDFDVSNGKWKKVLARETSILLIFLLFALTILVIVSNSFPKYCKYESSRLWKKGNQISVEITQIQKSNRILEEINNYGGIFYETLEPNQCINLTEFNTAFFFSSSVNQFKFDSGWIVLIDLDADFNEYYERARSGKLKKFSTLESDAEKSYSSFVTYLRNEAPIEVKEFIRSDLIQKSIKGDWQLGLRTSESDYANETLESLVFQKHDPFKIYEDIYKSGPLFSKYKVLIELYNLKKNNSLENIFWNIKQKCDDYERHTTDWDYLVKQQLNFCGKMSYFLKKNKLDTYRDFTNNLERCYAFTTNIEVYKKCYELETSWAKINEDLGKIQAMKNKEKTTLFYLLLILPHLMIVVFILFPIRYFTSLLIWGVKSSIVRS